MSTKKPSLKDECLSFARQYVTDHGYPAGHDALCLRFGGPNVEALIEAGLLAFRGGHSGYVAVDVPTVQMSFDIEVTA